MNTPKNIHELLQVAGSFFKVRFHLPRSREDEEAIIDSIGKGVEFRGTNVWILMFAVFLASIGLNINSSAVIIGAMLVSPLMGPIMGIGLGLGIFDFDLIKMAAKNLLIMTAVSLTTSTVYFLISPLNVETSELLARTTPTVWDVLIAVFGGLAGIIAGASKEKGNVIPGVAIATALMPPLCTAGFGLARGNFYFFSGALYLFCINTVFISVSTFFVARVLKFPVKSFVNSIVEKKIKRIVTTIIVVTFIPSVFVAYFTVKKEVFNERAKAFIRKEVKFPNAVVFKQEIDYENNTISLFLIGQKVTGQAIKELENAESKYNLEGVKLQVIQGRGALEESDMETMRTDLLKELYKRNDSIGRMKDSSIAFLKQKLKEKALQEVSIESITRELAALNNNLITLTIQNSIFYNVKKNISDTVPVAIAQFAVQPTKKETAIIANWLKVRLKKDTLRLIINARYR